MCAFALCRLSIQQPCVMIAIVTLLLHTRRLECRGHLCPGNRHRDSSADSASPSAVSRAPVPLGVLETWRT